MSELDITEHPPGAAWGSGLQVGRYTLVAKIAVGGMAEIWVARQGGLKGFEKIVVIKKILDANSDPNAIEMFLDEARIAAQLTHPNIVQIFDLGEEAGSYYIAMEYIFGETLARVVRQGAESNKPLPISYAVKLVSAAAEGLAYAHEKTSLDGTPLHIVHRDISPQNLLVTHDGIMKVVDFGIAKAANRSGESKTAAGTFKGKISYASPEQARAEELDGRSDVFCLGIVLYEAISRSRLFKYDDPIAAIKALMGPEPIPSPRSRNPEIDEQLDAIVMKALERDRNTRYQSAREFQAALEGWLRGELDAPGTAQIGDYMKSLFAERMALQLKVIEAAKEGKSGISQIANDSDDVSMPGTRSSRGRKKAPNRMLQAGVVAGVALLVGLGVAWVATGTGTPQPAPEAPPVKVIPAELALSTEPAGAKVSVDGVDWGPTPVRKEVTVGSHVITATAEGYEPGERKVHVERKGQLLDILLTLKAAAPAAPEDAGATEAATAQAPVNKAARGKLSLRTSPWTEVYENGRKLGDTPLVDLPLAAGTHTLSLVNAEKNVRASVQVVVKPGQTTTLVKKF